MDYPSLFGEHRHLVLDELLTDPLRSVVHQYALKRALHTPETSWGSLVRGTPVFYGDPLAETLLELFHGAATELSGLDLELTFAELLVHGRGAAQNPIRARDAAEVRLTVHVGSVVDAPWPLLLELDDAEVEVDLEPGAALLHRPSTDPVRREPLVGSHLVELQLNYVDRDGPFAHLRYDGREEIGALPSVAQQLPDRNPERRHGYVQEVFDEEVLVHYPDTDETFALNLTAALVWAHCDGETSPAAIIEQLEAAFPDAGKQVADGVEAALAELRAIGAIEP